MWPLKFERALQTLWPHGDQHVPGLIESIVAASDVLLKPFSPATVAQIFAQFSEECGAGLEMIENLNYSIEGLRRTWPSHFTASMAERYAHNPRMIADIAYGGRMDNAPPPSDDGWNFRGRGLSQVTGRDGYTKLGLAVGHDLVADPDYVNDPQFALLCGLNDFKLCGALEHAEKNDIVATTRALNGGLIGLAAREAWLARWRRELAVE